MALIGFYYQDKEKGILREDLLTDKAQELAKNFLSVRPRLNAAQLRRFFNEVRALDAKVKAEKYEEGFEKVKPLIKMLKSKVAYSAGSGRVPREFRDFIFTCVDKIKDRDDFMGFVRHFESVVGFFYGEGGGR